MKNQFNSIQWQKIKLNGRDYSKTTSTTKTFSITFDWIDTDDCLIICSKIRTSLMIFLFFHLWDVKIRMFFPSWLSLFMPYSFVKDNNFMSLTQVTQDLHANKHTLLLRLNDWFVNDESHIVKIHSSVYL